MEIASTKARLAELFAESAVDGGRGARSGHVGAHFRFYVVDAN
jgi:hypothetical protein